MTKPTLEQRLTALENEVAALKQALANGTQPKDWRRTVGMFTGDEIVREAFAEAMKIREADRAKARRRTSGQRRAKA